MNVEKLFQKLSHGPLSNLSLSNDGSGTIKESSRPKIIMYADDALMRLYTRFVLKENDVLIEMYEEITNYHLKKRFALSQWDPDEEPIAYIIDLPNEPFEEDVIKILEVFGSEGKKIPLNDAERYDSVFTPQAKVLQIPRPNPGGMISITYQARHAELTGDLSQDIELPATLESAFISYIAYKVFSDMNSPESNNKAQEHYSNFESLCGEAENRDLVGNSVSNTNVRFQKNGWV